MTHSCLPKPEGTLLFLYYFSCKSGEVSKQKKRKVLFGKRVFLLFFIVLRQKKKQHQNFTTTKWKFYFFKGKTKKEIPNNRKRKYLFSGRTPFTQKKRKFTFFCFFLPEIVGSLDKMILMLPEMRGSFLFHILIIYLKSEEVYKKQEKFTSNGRNFPYKEGFTEKMGKLFISRQPLPKKGGISELFVIVFPKNSWKFGW